jgi:polysaccharide export outer membrane protein
MHTIASLNGVYIFYFLFLAHFELFLVNFMTMYRSIRRNLVNFGLIVILFLYTFSVACVSPKKILYFSDIKQDTMGSPPVVVSHTTPYVDPKILPNDILSITVQTIAQNEGNAPMAPNSLGGGKDLYTGFLVDKDGYVEVSLIGYVKVGGLTTQEAKEVLKQKAKTYYKEPVVNVRILNFDIQVLGDVGKAGIVTIPSEKASVIDVIAMSGDLQLTAKRKNILLVRTEGDEKKFVRLDMTSSAIFQSPYYWVRQRDLLYVEPSNYKIQNSDNSFLRYFGIGSSVVSVISLLFAFKVIK